MKGSEHRLATRLKGKLPVELEFGTGVTRDFSSSGVFFVTDCSIVAGQPIEFTLVLEHIEPGKPIRVRCLGESVRVEASDQKIGVAATIQSHTIDSELTPASPLFCRWKETCHEP